MVEATKKKRRAKPKHIDQTGLVRIATSPNESAKSTTTTRDVLSHRLPGFDL
ncbi:hypothetical protein YC2023_030679 [Brassica napus]